jgi:hypothetical protein
MPWSVFAFGQPIRADWACGHSRKNDRLPLPFRVVSIAKAGGIRHASRLSPDCPAARSRQLRAGFRALPACGCRQDRRREPARSFVHAADQALEQLQVGQVGGVRGGGQSGGHRSISRCRLGRRGAGERSIVLENSMPEVERPSAVSRGSPIAAPATLSAHHTAASTGMLRNLPNDAKTL